MISTEEAARRLRLFAEHDAAGRSPLYQHLAAQAADDTEVAGLLTVPESQDAQPTLLLAVAHRLLQADPIHPLSRYYPSLGGFDGVDSETWPLFRRFLLERKDRATELLATRYTQTNEVRRAALLYPGVAFAARQAGGPVALLEVGCSAGLLLGLDGYGYRYQCAGGEQLVAGPAKAAVGLHCALELANGATLPKLPKKLAVGARAGLDRRPIDATDEDELAWLEACVWADQPDRVRLLRTAAAAQRKKPPTLIAGDAVDDLGRATAQLPAELPLIVFTSHALPYLPAQRRQDFLAALQELAGRRPLWWVSTEPFRAALRFLLPDTEEPLAGSDWAVGTLAVVHWPGGGSPEISVLARTEPHGSRLAWLA